MTKLAYGAMVTLLAKPGTAILETLTPQKAELWHHASCIPGEAAELFEAINRGDLVNMIEELGDIEFYLEGVRQAAQITREETLKDFLKNELHDLPIRAGDVFDAVKKHVIYNKDFDRNHLIEALVNFEGALSDVREFNNITREETLEHNYDKLMNKRYPNGYTDEAAQARADKV